MDLTEFYEAIERERQEAVDTLVKRYHTIGPILGKIEEVSLTPDYQPSLRSPQEVLVTSGDLHC
jgi:hypothetical protein